MPEQTNLVIGWSLCHVAKPNVILGLFFVAKTSLVNWRFLLPDDYHDYYH